MTDWVTPKQFHETAGLDDWRVLGDGACTYFRTGSLEEGLRLVQAISEVGDLEAGHPDIDLRFEGVTVRLITITPDYFGLSERDVELARTISAVARDLGLTADPSVVQSVQIAIDALVHPDVIPFWRAVLGYAMLGYAGDPAGEDLIDPHRRGAALWFQQMDAPRPERNRLHVDVFVPYEEAEKRVAAAIAAGGHLVSDKHAPEGWTLADSEGNEVDVATTITRD
jgi:4a-hydroxytetrahydrobiopterin dehydratase